jgi:hypothetical protein
MDKHTKAFIEFVEKTSEEDAKDKGSTYSSIVEQAIDKSKFWKGEKEDPESFWTQRQILSGYKDDLIHRWKFLMESGDRFDIKKVKFWDVMDYFCDESTEGN